MNPLNQLHTMNSNLSGADLVAFADDHLDKTLERYERGFAPFWEGQTEVSKTLVVLGSGALVISVSLVQLLADRGSQPVVPWLLPISWILFGSTVVLGVSRIGWSSHARTVRLLLEVKRGDIRKQIAALQPGPDFAERFDQVLERAFEEASIHPQKAIKIYDRLTSAMGLSWLLGLAALLGFGIANLPF